MERLPLSGAGASNTTAGSISAPPTALSNEQKPLEDGETAEAGPSDATVPAGLETKQFTVTKEEAEDLNAQVQTIKTKGALSMWKKKALM